jgi:hypothetical protein
MAPPLRSLIDVLSLGYPRAPVFETIGGRFGRPTLERWAGNAGVRGVES